MISLGCAAEMRTTSDKSIRGRQAASRVGGVQEERSTGVYMCGAIENRMRTIRAQHQQQIAAACL